eukprot:602211_1
MAAQGITTAKLETSTFNFNQWVNENKLNEIKDLLRKHKMTNINSLRTTSAEYFKLMSDPALLAKGHALPRLMAALQKVPRNTTPPQVIRIMISKKRIWGNGQYLMMIMRERKERYLAAYTKRLQRIYCTYQPSKLNKIDGWVAKYGVDVDKLHELYMKICSKYELEPCDKYDGSEHEKVPDDEENEKRAATAPVQSLSQNLNEDKTKEATTDTGKNGMATSSPWSVNTDSSKEAVDTTHSSTSNAQPVHVSFYDVPNPFASNSTTSTTKHFMSSNNTKSKGWSFTLKSTASKDHNRNSGSTWNNKDGGSIGAVQFSIPTNMLFSSSNDEKDNDTKHEKDFFFISKKQTTKSRRRVIFKARRRCFE